MRQKPIPEVNSRWQL